MRIFIKKTLPGMNYHRKIYIPRMYEELTVDAIYEEISSGSIYKTGNK